MVSRRRIEVPLSAAIKRALMIILADGEVIENAGYWAGSSAQKIQQRTIETAYDRFLVHMVVESRHRKRHMARLTDIGERVARDLHRELFGDLNPSIPECNHLLI